jgi:acyl-CoA oxidase
MRGAHDTERWTIPTTLLPFAPLLYVAWADGALGRTEMVSLREHVRTAGLDARSGALIDTWLDPDDPPGAVELSRLLEAVHECAERFGETECVSLSRMGEAVARVRGHVVSGVERRALETMEAALGISGPEAARSLLPVSEETPAPAPVPKFDVGALKRVLDADHAGLRVRLLDLLTSPDFAYVPARDIAKYRGHVLRWCRILAEQGYGGLGYPREFGGEHDLTSAIAAFETIAYHDLSLLVKFGVQFGLFGGSVYQLGTRHHHETYLRAIAALELPGCFAMTEIGHGSNVRDIETTATYDGAAGEFVIQTPHPGARKDWIGNAALHGRMATVFAQLQIGDEHHGVHAILVPLRDARGNVLPGITIEDCGSKEGLNGVDNGRISFHSVRVPRLNLLDRFGQVSEDGVYTSTIASKSRRFFTMLGTLVAGRISIAAGAMSAAKSGLTIAIRYADRRRQFGPEGGLEVPILDYLMVQRHLLPALAQTYALDFAMKDLIRVYAEMKAEDAREIEALAAGLKALSSTHTVNTLQACREACGGQGYLEANRIPILKADTDVFTTFEGANDVLLQLVAKGLLTEYREHFGELRLWSAVRWLSGRAADAIAERNPIATRRTEPEHLRDPAFHGAAFRFREARLLGSLARRLRARIGEGEDSFSALNACQDHAVALAMASMDRFVLESFHAGMGAVADESARHALEPLAALHALSLIERDLGWYLEKGYIEPPKARAIRAEVNRLCHEIRADAVPLVDAFGIPDALLRG